jgi:hypothetical protein
VGERARTVKGKEGGGVAIWQSRANIPIMGPGTGFSYHGAKGVTCDSFDRPCAGGGHIERRKVCSNRSFFLKSHGTKMI